MLMPRYSEPDSHSDKSFAGNHGHASTTVAAHTKMRLLSKVEHNMRQSQQHLQQHPNPSPNPNSNPGQNQSINKLIHTAATGNGLVGDVDELLTPMRIKAHVAQSMSSSLSGGSGSFSGDKETMPHSRPERNLWSRAEMLEMLNIMQQMNALEQLNDRNVKSEHVFRQIEEVMRSKGYVKKSSIQIWTKWKFLKSTYNTTTRHGTGIPKVVPEEVYRVLCRMLREHANASANGSGSGISSECGNSRDSSSADLSKTLPSNGDDVKEELGVEHPIFGFRLGLIKPEPLDTGYETTLNHATDQEIEPVDFVQSGDSSHDPAASLEHTPFLMNVKHEPEMDLGMDDTNTPPPTAPTSPSPPPASLQEQLDTDALSPPYTGRTQSATVPPLRVAAFASDAQRMVTSTPTHGILQIERPSAPPGKTSLNGGPGRGNRSLPLHSTSSINFVHPTSKLMLPRKQLPMRIPREISVQPAKMRALKAVPMRETGYSLRPDRMIPDLEQSISPPQSPSPPILGQPAAKYGIPYATTSRQAQLLSEQQEQLQQPQRKRRMQFAQQTPVPVKLQRSSTLFEAKPNGSLGHADAATEEHRGKLAAEEAQRRKQQQQQEQQEELFKKELTQLANAMRSAQKEMLEDFFQQQKQFARREHEFQLKQDNLVMSALRKQTDALLRTAKDLMQCNELEMGAEAEGETDMEAEQQLECPKTHQQQKEDMLLLQPEIELQEELENQEDEETEQDPEQDLEQYEEETQYSDEGNQSEAAMEASTSAASEYASNHSDHPSDAQIC